jgi:hypothetical protein
VTLRVSIEGGAVFGADQPEGCNPDGAVVECTFTQPAAGATLAFDLAVEGATEPGTATAEVLRDGETEASLSVDLEPYESGLVITGATWAPMATGGVALPGVLAEVTVTSTSGVAVDEASVVMEAGGDSAFVPRGVDADAAVAALGDRLFLAGWGRGLAEAFRQPLSQPAPEGCVASLPPSIDWSSALTTDGLPHTLTCDIGPIGAGETVTLPGVLILGYPAFFNGNDVVEHGTVTTTLHERGAVVGSAEAFTMPAVDPPSAQTAVDIRVNAG